MDVGALFIKGSKYLQIHSAEVFTAVGVTGVVGTAYMTAKGTAKAVRKIDQEKPDTLKEKVKLVWPDYVSPALMGTATIGAIFGAHKANARRTAAAVAAYSLSNQAFNEYKEQLIELVDEKTDSKVKEEIATKRVSEAPPPENHDSIVFAGGDVLCCDLLTMRYFRSDMETLRKAENTINERLLRERWMSVREFYHELEVYPHEHMDRLGWSIETGLMELVFTPVLTPKGEPCLAFTFNYTQPL